MKDISIGDEVTVEVKYDGIHRAEVTAISGDRVLVMFPKPVRVNNRGDKGAWTWVDRGAIKVVSVVGDV